MAIRTVVDNNVERCHNVWGETQNSVRQGAADLRFICSLQIQSQLFWWAIENRTEEMAMLWTLSGFYESEICVTETSV
jgi:hypothetical protein